MVGFHHSPAIAQTTLSKVKLCPSFTEFDCFHAVWNETSLQSFNALNSSINCLYFVKINFNCLYAL